MPGVAATGREETTCAGRPWLVLNDWLRSLMALFRTATWVAIGRACCSCMAAISDGRGLAWTPRGPLKLVRVLLVTVTLWL